MPAVYTLVYALGLPFGINDPHTISVNCLKRSRLIVLRLSYICPVAVLPEVVILGPGTRLSIVVTSSIINGRGIVADRAYHQ